LFCFYSETDIVADTLHDSGGLCRSLARAEIWLG